GCGLAVARRVAAAGPPPAGAAQSALGGQEPLHRLARPLDRGMGRGAEPYLARRAGRARDGRGAHLRARLAARRSGDLGQSLPPPPRQRLRCRPLSPLHAPDARARRRPDPRRIRVIGRRWEISLDLPPLRNTSVVQPPRTAAKRALAASPEPASE